MELEGEKGRNEGYAIGEFESCLNNDMLKYFTDSMTMDALLTLINSRYITPKSFPWRKQLSNRVRRQ